MHDEETVNNSNTISGKIKVASRIIDYLSSGLYNTPAACLKELVNNAYDAGATRVDIYVKPDADQIIIEDNGQGMSKEEFQSHFDRISESHKRDDTDHVKRRPKIGKIGIGMIAANELCEIMEIYTTKEGSAELLHVFINFDEMRKPPHERKTANDEYTKADYSGVIYTTDHEAHYTKIFLTSIRGESKNILNGANAGDPKGDAISLYGRSPQSVEKILMGRPDSWKRFDLYSETMLRIALNVPVRYYPNWIPSSLKSEVTDMEVEIEELDFSVFYDGTELFKPTVLNPPDEYFILKRFEFKGELVSAHGYFYAQHTSIKPQDINGLLVRIRNSAVAEYDPEFWGFPKSRHGLIKNWVSCEVWANDGLEVAMNIDRRTLRPVHPAYVELRNALHSFLNTFLNEATEEVYRVPSRQRKSEKTTIEVKDIQEFVSSKLQPVAPVASANIGRFIAKSQSDVKARRFVQRQYSFVEFYEVVLEVAQETLPPDVLPIFIEKLTERIQR